LVKIVTHAVVGARIGQNRKSETKIVVCTTSSKTSKYLIILAGCNLLATGFKKKTLNKPTCHGG
jgi:hypothetical protein